MWKNTITWCLCLAGCMIILPVTANEEGLLGHWTFDEGQGEVAGDRSGHEHHGEIWDAEWVRGNFGTALKFNGHGAYVAIPEISKLDGVNALTVEAWVLWEGTGKYPNIVSGGTWSPGGFLLFVNNRQCSFRMGRPNVSASVTPSEWREVGVPLLASFKEGQWVHLAATFQRPVITTYVDGQPVATGKWDHPVAQRNDLLIGKWSGATHQGLIDEVKVFNRARSADEILAGYRAQADRRSTTPAGRPMYETIPRAAPLAVAAKTFQNDFATLAIGRHGRCTALIDRQTDENQLLRSTALVSIKQAGSIHRRCVCAWENGKLVFRFAKAKTSVTVDVEEKPAYFVFDVVSVEGPGVEEVTFVHLNLEERRHVHAMSGLAADERFSVCLRTLNLETQVRVGGNPPELTATAFREHGLDRGRAALVACPTPAARPVLRELVRNEDLPYSELGGAFALDAAPNRGSYVFANVSESTIDRWIALARRGGIDCIHMNGWAKSLGHYEPRETAFPRGLESLKDIVRKIHDAGLKAGIHTLTGCISPHDSWVRPVPDRRLATDGTFTLAAGLDAGSTRIPTAGPPGDYPTVWAYSSRGNCIRIDDELIQYSAIANEPPYGFQNALRGAFGTRPAAHEQGAQVHHLIARYGCFIPDEHSTLVNEVADAIAHVYNTCDLDQIYMDGAEAMRGWYGIARMREAIYTRLQRPALVEASCWDHHSWPFHSRVGAWDHPKWGLKRFADDHLRAVEQYRKACLLEAQLGWWVVLGPDRDWDMERPDEIEYLCAKALGHDVPLSFQSVAVNGRPPNARQDEYFTLIGQYERLRQANYFDEAVLAKLREERQEFHLAQAPDGEWELVPTDYVQHKVTGLSDGSNEWTVPNRYAVQPMRLRLHALYSPYPYDDEQSLQLVEFTSDDEFVPSGTAPGVQCALRSATDPRKGGAASGRLTGMNRCTSPRGAWGRFVKTFDPVKNMTPHDAIGLWVHGDGEGEVINLQLTNLPEYFRTLDDHQIKVDFQGWRYVELLMRERDAAAYHDHQWPYGAHCVLHRSPLVRHVVSGLTVYVNHLPPAKEVTCYLGPIRALRTRKVVLRNPTIEAGGRRLVFPVALESGMVIEFDSMDDCRLYDERGSLLQRLEPQGEVPFLGAGENRVLFTCEGTRGFRSRAEVTVAPRGPRLRGRRGAARWRPL